MLSLLVLLLAACGGSGTSDPLKNPGTNPFGKALPTSSGVPQVDQLLAAASQCGYQSWSTIPAGWNMVLVGSQGCATWAPPTWTATGAGTEMTSIEAPPDGETGALVLAGSPPLGTQIQCTPRGASDYIMAGLAQTGCNNMTTLYYKEGVDNVLGLQIPKADVVLSCTDVDSKTVGYLWVTIQGTSPLCSILVLGFWMPEGSIATATCTATQVIQSIKCPQPGGGYCDSSSCNSDCVQLGHTGGQCDANDDCQCS